VCSGKTVTLDEHPRTSTVGHMFDMVAQYAAVQI